ncbi:hypothetical protein KFK14_19085 [Sphingobium phenoxybenzoativorans]|uniref:Uncharacterized protein n=1 Tax=Sphingobium phenoxybenzoativorans TaxID=1592790 RepID=A0A975K6P7_9SPHN|nr:hypothetical protein [Sphingobium phenoxybenzoativorans]QUT05088.1 hypothetical protein KFK14_19085 [Sphingobium phenoxybenzoativorans]
MAVNDLKGSILREYAYLFHWKCGCQAQTGAGLPVMKISATPTPFEVIFMGPKRE